MIIKMTKIAATALLLTSATFAEESGPKVEFTGYLDVDVAGTFDSDAKQFSYYNQHEADLITTIKFSDKVSVGLGMTSYTPNAVPYGGTPTIDDDGDPTRWSLMYFDGIWASYAAENGATVTAGDMTITKGVFSYYAYKRPMYNASILKETYIRGLGLDYMGASLYAGATDSSNTTAGLYAGYSWSNDAVTVNPFVYTTNDMAGATDLTAGLTSDIKIGEHLVTAAYGFLKKGELDPTSTFKLEATLAFGPMTVYGTAYYALIGETTPATTEESFYYVEPDYKINDLFTVGSTFELHTMEKGDKDSKFSAYPTVYMTPADGVQFVVWAGPTKYLDDKEANIGIDMGSELIASF